MDHLHSLAKYTEHGFNRNGQYFLLFTDPFGHAAFCAHLGSLPRMAPDERTWGFDDLGIFGVSCHCYCA